MAENREDVDAQPIADSTLRSLPEGHPGWNTPAVSQEFIRAPDEVDIRPETDHRPDPDSGIDPVEAAESFPSQDQVLAAPLDESMIAGETREEVTGKSESPDVEADGGDTDESRDELYAKAQELDIEGRSTMNKEELAEAVAEAEKEAGNGG